MEIDVVEYVVDCKKNFLHLQYFSEKKTGILHMYKLIIIFRILFLTFWIFSLFFIQSQMTEAREGVNPDHEPENRNARHERSNKNSQDVSLNKFCFEISRQYTPVFRGAA